jgi:hypothetical protein
MISELSIEQSQLEYTIRREWKNRFYRYDNTKYKNDCLVFLKRFCKAEKLRIPVILFLDSPAGCLFATAVIKALKEKGLTTYQQNCFSDNFFLDIWEDEFSNNELLNSATIEVSERDSIINASLNSIEGVNLKTDDNYPDQSYGNAFQYFFNSRNMEKIKKIISVHVWETYYPTGIPINGDLMISSLNQFPDENGTIKPYNYEEYLFFDLMSRLSVIQDDLYNDLKQLLLNGVFDFFWDNQICLISKLPESIKRNKSGSLARKGVGLSFFDGYKYRTK